MLLEQNHITTCFFSASRQFANGAREEMRKSLTSSRTRLRRAVSFSMRAASASQSPSYHSGGMASANEASSAGEKSSMRSSQGWNDSHPRTPEYTALKANTPRKGESGKFHSPALKQWPRSTSARVYLRSRPRRQ